MIHTRRTCSYLNLSVCMPIYIAVGTSGATSLLSETGCYGKRHVTDLPNENATGSFAGVIVNTNVPWQPNFAGV